MRKATDSDFNQRATTFAASGARTLAALAFASIAICAASANCHAQSTVLGQGEFAGSKGAVALNQVAGVANQESNNALIAPGDSHLTVTQTLTADLDAATRVSAKIGEGVAAGSTGLVQINQASGNGNELANAAFIGFSADAAQPLNPVVLSQTRASSSPTNLHGQLFQGQATIAASAFQGASGVVQANQVAGNNNLAANVVSLHVSP